MKILALAVLTTVLSTGCFRVIDASEVGISKSLGSYNEVPLTEGFYLTVPLLRSITTIDMKQQVATGVTASSSKDMQNIGIEYKIVYRINKVGVVETLKTIGEEDAINVAVVYNTVVEEIKKAAAHFTAEEQITRRSELRDMAYNSIAMKFKNSPVSLIDLNILNISFEKDFMDSIEAKQIAEQHSLAANYLEAKKAAEGRGTVATATAAGEAQVALAKAAATAKVMTATASAEANNLLTKSLTPRVLKNLYLEKWDGKLPRVTSGSDTSLMINVDTK